MLRLTVPSIDGDDLKAVADVLATGYLVQGVQVRRFEQQTAVLAETPHAIAVSNGTAALHLALLALGCAPGDLIPVTAYSWISTANVIELCGAQPVFVDIEPRTFNMDPECLRRVLDRLMANRETARRVKAVLPIHAFGHMADMPAILEAAGRYGIPVIEDAACALGSQLDGRPAGSWGRIGTFSFHPRKAVTTGEGGMVTTSDDRLAWTLRSLRNHGLDPDSPTPDFVMPGFNYRITEFQAALGIVQLGKLERILNARRRLAANYDALLAGTPLTPPAVGLGHAPAYQSYICLLPEQASARRASLIEAWKQQGVETNIGTWHMPLTTYFRTRYGYAPGDFPVTDDIFARSLALPLYETLTGEQQEYVTRTLLASLQ